MPVNEAKLTMDEAQSLMMALCFTHQIVNQAISIPEPIYQADEWAKRGRNNFRAMVYVLRVELSIHQGTSLFCGMLPTVLSFKRSSSTDGFFGFHAFFHICVYANEKRIVCQSCSSAYPRALSLHLDPIFIKFEDYVPDDQITLLFQFYPVLPSLLLVTCTTGSIAPGSLVQFLASPPCFLTPSFHW